MTVITVASVAGSPGATRLAVGLAAAWPESERPRVLVEADPDGGRLGAELGIGVEPGLMAVAMAARATGLTPDEVLQRGAAPVADWHVVPAPPSAEQTHSLLAHAGATLAEVVTADPAGPLWIIDCGRLSARSPALPFARAAGHVLVVSSGSFPMLQLVPHRVGALRSAGCQVSVVLVEPTSWPPDEVADFVGTDVAALLPRVRVPGDDLAAMRSTPWRAWWRRVDELAAYLAAVPAAVPAGAAR